MATIAGQAASLCLRNSMLETKCWPHCSHLRNPPASSAAPLLWMMEFMKGSSGFVLEERVKNWSASTSSASSMVSRATRS